MRFILAIGLFSIESVDGINAVVSTAISAAMASDSTSQTLLGLMLFLAAGALRRKSTASIAARDDKSPSGRRLFPISQHGQPANQVI